MPKNRKVKVVAGIVASFTGFAGDYSAIGNENNKLRDGEANACCVGGDVRGIRNSDCYLSLDQ
jgi:hypothetical protein